MPRFFVDVHARINNELTIAGTPVAHIRALRIRAGDEFTVCDGARSDYLCRLLSLEGDTVKAQILEYAPSVGEPRTYCAVYLAMSKGDRLEYAVQKCVELGAAELVLFPTERSVARPDASALKKRVARLQAISQSAAEQSGRGIIPKIRAAQSFSAALDEVATADAGLFFYEEARETGIFDALEFRSSLESVSIITGAEGGFTPDEARAAAERGLTHVSLGPRILRCDTAPVAALACVMLCLEEM